MIASRSVKLYGNPVSIKKPHQKPEKSDKDIEQSKSINVYRDSSNIQKVSISKIMQGKVLRICGK
jgi:hypothetical protein